MKKAMETRLGSEAEEVAKVLFENGIPRNLVKKALEMAQAQGGCTIYSLVDAMTRLSQEIRFAGDRVDLDAKIGGLLELAV